MSSHSLVVLGSLNVDHVVRVGAFPRPGETVVGRGYQVGPGGKGSNQALAAVRAGADTAFVACVGNDDFGRQMIGFFVAEGIDTRAMMPVANTRTGVALIFVDQSGENSIAISAEANAHLTPQKVKPHLDLIEGAGMLLMQLESPLETVELAAEAASAAGVQVVLNPAPARPLPDSLLSRVDLITPNQTETELLTGVVVNGREGAARASAILHEKGIETVVITLGESGAYVSRQNKGSLIPGFKVAPVDTTAAGDTFNGALAAVLLEGQDLERAVCFAHACAAISITGLGSQTSIPTRDQSMVFLKNYSEHR
jgi:ribokinase